MVCITHRFQRPAPTQAQPTETTMNGKQLLNQALRMERTAVTAAEFNEVERLKLVAKSRIERDQKEFERRRS